MLCSKDTDEELGRLWAQIVALEQWLELDGRAAGQEAAGIKQIVAELRQAAQNQQVSETSLRNQAEILQSILDSLCEGVIATDERGKVLIFNPAAEQILSVQPIDVPPEEWAERYGLYLCDQITPYMRDKHPLARALRGKSVDGVEIFIRPAQRLDGIWVNVSARPLKYQNSASRGAVIVFHNITERKRVELLQRDSEALYHSLVENLPQNIFRKDREGHFIFGNRMFCTALGKRLAEIIGKTDFDFFPPELAGKYRQDDLRVIATGEIFETIEEHVKPDGTTTYVQIVRTPVYDSRGAIIGTQGIFWDITERRRVEEALRKAHMQTEQWLTAISSILISVDEHDRVAQWNRMAENAFGIAAADIMGRPFHECGISWDWTSVLECVAEAQKKGSPIRKDNIRFRRADGKEGFLGVTVSPIKGDEDRSMGFLLLGADITERKQLESQLVQAQKLESIGQLAAGIAHEINTPIQYIGDNTTFLREAFEDLTKLFTKYDEWLVAVQQARVPPSLVDEIEAAAKDADLAYLREEIPKAIGQSLDGVDRVAKIVRAMKEFSHPGTEKQTPVDLNRAIENTITVSRTEWKYVAELVTNFAPDLPPITCLPGPINQVVLNLIVNAAHAIADRVAKDSQHKGIITVSTRRDGQWAEIRISDNGAGIPEAVRGKIFDPFFTTKDVGKGTGQGLAIAHTVIVKTHGGTITFETEVGKGTTFILRLPMAGTTAKAS